MGYIQRGTSAFQKVNLALFAGGFSTFAILWGTQPLLPDIAKEFHVSPAVSSFVMSAATFSLAVSMLIAGSLSEVFGRKPIMALSLVASSALAVLTSVTPSFPLLLAGRIAEGAVLAGLPAVAMAYLGEEVEPRSLGMAMGLYISGNSLGGMAGRIISGILTDYINWHAALMGIGFISLLSSLVFWLLLPPSSHFMPRKLEGRRLLGSLFGQFKEPGLIYLFAIGFLLSGIFVSLYNYIGFQLMKPPYSLSQTVVGFIFIVYMVGTFSSTWMGMLADKHGKGKILQLSLLIILVGGCITLDMSLWLKILGLAVLTYGFFAGHSIASGWVGTIATHDKAQAAALYLFFYYFGASIGGTASGTIYSHFGWSGVVYTTAVLALISILLSIRLAAIAAGKWKTARQYTKLS